MAYVFDLIIVCTLIFMIVIGYRRGFVQSLVQIAGYVLAFVLALSLSTPIANAVFDGAIAEGVETKLTESFVGAVDGSPSEKANAFIEGLPGPIASALLKNESVTDTLRDLDENLELSAQKFAETVVENAIRPVVVSLIRIVLFILLFILLSLAIKLLAKLFKPLTNLPLIRQVDGVLGAVLGLLKGIVFVLAFVSILQLVAALSPADGAFTQETLDGGLLIGWIADINPLSGVIA